MVKIYKCALLVFLMTLLFCDLNAQNSISQLPWKSVAKNAFWKGIDCILKTQIIVKGRPTVWCAQHDENTFLPAKARSYELPSFSGGESAGILNLLMEIPNPSPAIIKSVQGAIEWLDAHRIKNIRWESFINKDGLKT